VVGGKGFLELEGPQKGERRLTTRMTVVGGVSSPKWGRNGGGGSNFDGGSSAPVTRHGHEDEGEWRWGVHCSHGKEEGRKRESGSDGRNTL
jgi:hypothetical protein